MGQTGSRTYDTFGRTFHKVDFKGQTNELVYDGIGRLTTNQFYASGASAPMVASAYAYDAEDRTAQILEPRGTNAFIYDNDGHVTQINSPEGAVNYEYEPVGGRRVRIYTTNSDLRYGYDLLGRVSTVSVFKRNGVMLTTPETTTNYYTALSGLQDVYYPNGVHARYQYDGLMNRLTNLTYMSSSVSLAQYQYVSGTNGKWNSATEIQRQANGTYVTNLLGWFYDNLGRLTNEACSSTLTALNYTNQYVYDLVGNRLWQTNQSVAGIAVTGYTYNDNDQLLREVTMGSANGIFTNLYDENGALTNHSSATEQNAYAYNLQNRLATAVISRTDGEHQMAETINYTYDYKGNRVRAQWTRSLDGGAAASGTNIFLFDLNSPSGMNQVIEEMPGIGAPPTASYALGGQIVSQERSGTISYFLSDGHGSTRQLADTNGGIAARFTYDAYGKALDFTNGVQVPTLTSLLYGGGRFDSDLQLYDLNARYYDPIAGTFNQIDPYSLNQKSGANLYAYGAGDPVNNFDPSGMYEIDVHQYLTEYLAGQAGFDSIIAAGIGQQAQGPDGVITAAPQPDGAHVDQSRSAWDGSHINHENMKKYHFVLQDQLRNLAGMANTSDQEGMRHLGEFLHAQ